MSIDDFKEQMYKRSSKECIKKHLEDAYKMRVAEIIKLDLGVFRVDCFDGSSLIARQFPKARLIEDIKGDADILNFLAEKGFPAERCAVPNAVSSLDGQGILLTNFVQGTKLKGSPKAHYFQGILLGCLHSLQIESSQITRRGGAWHHLSVQGGPREEIDAALSLLKDAEPIVSEKQKPLYERLFEELKMADDFHDMPQALIHPDFVLPNMIKVDVANWVVLDWAGVGLGPRIWSLGFVLWAAGYRSIECVDALIAGYRRFINLDSNELKQISRAIGIRPLIFDIWAFCMGRKDLVDIMQESTKVHSTTEVISERAAQAFKERR